MTKLNILYEDNHLIVVVKPYNMPVQSDESKDLSLTDMIKQYLKEKYHKPGNVYLGLVHRLDRPVGGIMVFAKTSKAASRLSASIQNKEFSKRYLAIIKGELKLFESLKNYLDRSGKKAFVSNKNTGKYAELNYRVVEKNNNYNLVDIELITGRHHQIRVQFANINRPLYGDQLYGIQNKKQICLFSYYLSFPHPITKEILTFKYLPKGEMWNLFKMEDL